MCSRNGPPSMIFGLTHSLVPEGPIIMNEAPLLEHNAQNHIITIITRIMMREECSICPKKLQKTV